MLHYRAYRSHFSRVLRYDLRSVTLEKTGEDHENQKYTISVESW
jgi:hypothetical protein